MSIVSYIKQVIIKNRQEPELGTKSNEWIVVPRDVMDDLSVVYTANKKPRSYDMSGIPNETWVGW